jgi:hypothetical protein
LELNGWVICLELGLKPHGFRIGSRGGALFMLLMACHCCAETALPYWRQLFSLDFTCRGCIVFPIRPGTKAEIQDFLPRFPFAPTPACPMHEEFRDNFCRASKERLYENVPNVSAPDDVVCFLVVCSIDFNGNYRGKRNSAATGTLQRFHCAQRQPTSFAALVWRKCG